MDVRLCLNMASIKNAPLARQIGLAGAAGFDGVGLWMDDIDAAVRQGSSLEEISALVRGVGLTVEELCFLARWQDCDDAAVHGVRIALEFFGTAEEMRNIRTAWRLIEASGSSNGGRVLDTFHFFLAGSSPEDLAAVPGERIFLVHVSDAMAVSREKLSTFHDYRTFPGDGTIDYAPVLGRLERMGYRGAVSLEIWNQELLKANPESTARRGMESLRVLIGAGGIR